MHKIKDILDPGVNIFRPGPDAGQLLEGWRNRSVDIREQYDDIAQCNRCGFCQAAARSSAPPAHEEGVARGRLALLRAVIEDRIEWSPELEEPLYSCLLCGACTSNVFRDPDLGAGHHGALRVPRESGPEIHSSSAFRPVAAFSPAAASGRPARSPGQEQRHERVGPRPGLLSIFGRDLSRAEGIVDRFRPSRSGALQARGIRRAGPQSDGSVIS